jgi:hypothetical protein
MRIEIKAHVAENIEKRKNNKQLREFRNNWNLRYQEEMEMLLAPNEEDDLGMGGSSAVTQASPSSYTLLKNHVSLAVRQLNEATKNGVRLDQKNFVLLDVASNLADAIKQCDRLED